MATRQLGRGIGIQSLFEWDFYDRKEDIEKILERNLEEFAPGFSEKDFVIKLVRGVVEKIG